MSVDKRVLKTKRAIFTAFAQLLAEKDLSHITITDIANKADINRKTFYNYYTNIYEVMEEIENLTVSTFEKKLDQIEFEDMSSFINQLFVEFTETINSDLEFFSHLFKTNNRSVLIKKIVDSLKEYIMKRIEEKQEIDVDMFNMIADFCVPGIISVYMNWFMSNRSVSIETLSSHLTQLILNGTLSLLK